MIAAPPLPAPCKIDGDFCEVHEDEVLPGASECRGHADRLERRAAQIDTTQKILAHLRAACAIRCQGQESDVLGAVGCIEAEVFSSHGFDPESGSYSNLIRRAYPSVRIQTRTRTVTARWATLAQYALNISEGVFPTYPRTMDLWTGSDWDGVVLLAAVEPTPAPTPPPVAAAPLLDLSALKAKFGKRR